MTYIRLPTGWKRTSAVRFGEGYGKKTDLLLIPTSYTGGDNPTVTYTKASTQGTISSSTPTISPVGFYNFSITGVSSPDGLSKITFGFPKKAKKIKLYCSGGAAGSDAGVISFYSNGALIETWGQAAQSWNKGYTLIEVDVSNIQDPTSYLEIRLACYVGSTVNLVIYGLEYEY